MNIRFGRLNLVDLAGSERYDALMKNLFNHFASVESVEILNSLK